VVVPRLANKLTSTGLILADSEDEDSDNEDNDNNEGENLRTPPQVRSSSPSAATSPIAPIPSDPPRKEDDSYAPMKRRPTLQRDTAAHPPRVWAILRARAKDLEATASDFSFADAQRATAVAEVLQRWEAIVGGCRVLLVRRVEDEGGDSGEDQTKSNHTNGDESLERKDSITKSNNQDNNGKTEQGEEEKSIGAEGFSFEEVLAESKVVEIAVERFLQTVTIEVIMEATAKAEAAGWLSTLERFLQKQLLGGQHPEIISELLFQLIIAILDKKVSQILYEATVG